MGLPYEAPSGGYEDDSTSPDAGRYADDLTTPGYDGYSHDAAADGYRDADEYDFDEDEDEDEDLDFDLEGDELDEGGLGGQAGWDPGAGQTGGRGRM